ncbi:type IV pili methyl-accepting chemotaxis transducer N-terminal domain-containing protein [Azohydromonas caseinilytica]|uniref:ANTAR domain-containing protein n=1 Tax=Azohydromonas caseinilytica TaxID=2728836 RepID=A0A848F7W4_9BURK|nr:type IV pili methyl-accepting chemotaxis transducer N-terminal domain-containing protein [Azohydromonas caseinilytica]NML14639.1 ANTAR domain-containing protein [Azohydromonas caseinilytica]
MTSALVVCAPGTSAPPLSEELQAAGIHVLGACECDKLVQQALRCAPDVVVCWEPQPAQGGLFEALELLARTQPMPVLVFTADASVEGAQRALALGVAGWVVHGYAPTRLRALLQLARTRFEHEQRLRGERDEAQQRLEERKLVDRAKGILMRSHGLSEDEAFRRLRGAAMQGKLRVGRLSQHLIDAARDAEAINRAGQLRMLSQRLVALQALRLAPAPDFEAAAAQAAARQQAQRNLEHLDRTLSQATLGDLLQPLQSAWTLLERSLDAAPQLPDLGALDTAAEALLGAAERLTRALEANSALQTLSAVNLAGRQRMLGQRLLKQVLMGALLDTSEGAQALSQAAATAREFDQALQRLQQLPLSSPAIRIALDAAAREWLRMQQGVREAGHPTGRRQLALAAEALLARFEELTSDYERSAQQLFD